MIVKESLGRDALRLIIWFPFRWLIALLPAKYAFYVFKIMGSVHYQYSGAKKKAVIKNLKSAFGNRFDDRQIIRFAEKYFQNHYVNQMQIFVFPKLNTGNVEKVHTFEGLHYLDEALKKGKGCILLHPHFGPAQLPLTALGIGKYDMIQLGLPTDEGLSYIGRKVAFRIRCEFESRIPATIIHAESSMRSVIKGLRDNKALMITGDGAGGGKFIGKFIPVDYFGKKTLFPLGAAKLAKITGSPVLPIFTVPNGIAEYKTIIHEPIQTVGDEPEREYVLSFVHLLEMYVGKYPHFWRFWDELEQRTVT